MGWEPAVGGGCNLQNAERTTVRTKIAAAMSKYKSLDFAKKNQKFHKFFGRNLDITKIVRFLEFHYPGCQRLFFSFRKQRKEARRQAREEAKKTPSGHGRYKPHFHVYIF